jgi:methylmalonyl-CoA mutase N-terminal domain/subunit
LGWKLLRGASDEIADHAWKLIEEVEELGGMTKAIAGDSKT